MAELNNSSTGQWSEIDANNTSASPDGWPNGTFFNQVEPIGRSTMGAIKRFWDRINGTITSTGSANAYIYTPSNLSYPTAIVAGEEYSFKANFTNTGAATVNINSLGAIQIYKQSTSGPAPLSGGEIVTGQIVKLQYDGAHYQILSALSTSGNMATSIYDPANIAQQVVGTTAAQSISNKDLIGVTTNSNANAGSVGEYVSSQVLLASAVSLTSGITSDITSISLTAGDWDVWGNVATAPAGSTTTTLIVAWTSSTSATLPTIPNNGGYSQLVPANPAILINVLSAGLQRISLASTTTIYLSTNITFTTSTMKAYGFIGARRRR